jgi:hypothetical protein
MKFPFESRVSCVTAQSKKCDRKIKYKAKLRPMPLFPQNPESFLMPFPYAKVDMKIESSSEDQNKRC